jgi:DNA processing protein
LLKEFGSPEEVFRAPLPRLERCKLPAAVAQAVFKKQAFKRAEKELLSIRGIENCRLVSWTDPEYPQTLLQIYDPPVLLYVRGDVQVLNQPSISIVGTRRPTLYRTQIAERMGREIAGRGGQGDGAGDRCARPSGRDDREWPGNRGTGNWD